MKIAYLAAGAAGTHCGACTRDVALARELIRRGHDALLVPLYTPLTVDGKDPSVHRVFYGGINAWLEQKSALFRRRLPGVDRLLSSRWLLKAVSRFAVDTRPEDLGAMTVSVLEGTHGRQAKELEELMQFLESERPLEVVNLTNSLLSAVAPAVKRRLGVVVACTLQGEESFVARLPSPHRERAVAMMRQNADAIDAFVAPHASYVDEMAELLAVPRERFRVVRPGVNVAAYAPSHEVRRDAPLRIGCLSRIGEDKGTDLLCDAFVELDRRRPGRAALALAGLLPPGRRRWWEAKKARLGAADSRRFQFRGELDHDEKVAFLQGLDVFVQTSRLAERRGMAALEAMATGIAIVAPRRGIFPEIIERTGGGVLVEPESVEAIVSVLECLLDTPDDRARMSRAARAGVEQHFSSDLMATETLKVYQNLTSP